jgi:hypothetical protein
MAYEEKIAEMKKMSKQELFNYLTTEAFTKKGGFFFLVNLCVYLILKEEM